MQKMMQALLAQGHPDVALELALTQWSGQGLDAMLAEPAKIGMRVEMLKMVFDLAMKTRNGQVAEAAINALEEQGAGAKDAYESCEMQVDAHNEASLDDPESMVDEHRAALTQADFSIAFNDLESGSLKVTSKFDAAKHADLLLNYAEAVADASLGNRHATRFGLPVAQFMLNHFEELPPAAQVRLAGVCAKLIDKADSPNAMVQKLQLAIEHQLLKSAIGAAVQAGKSSSSSKNNPGVSALVWLLVNKDQLFGALQGSGIDVAAEITKALTALGATGIVLDVEVDANAARATLRSALSTSLEVLLQLFTHSRQAATSPLTESSRQCCTTLGGNAPSFAIIVLQQQLKLPLASAEQWQRLQATFQDLLEGMAKMVTAKAPPALLASIHSAVVDALVQLAEQNQTTPDVISWCISTLQALAKEGDMLALVSQASPQAQQGLQLALIFAQTIQFTATDLDAMHSFDARELRARLGNANEQLQTICKSPGTTLDRRLEATLRLVIATELKTKGSESMVMRTIFARTSLIARGQALEGLEPIPLALLVQVKEGARPHAFGGRARGSRAAPPIRTKCDVKRSVTDNGWLAA